MILFEAFKNISRQYYYEEEEDFNKDFSYTKDRIKNFFEIANKNNLAIDFDDLEIIRELHSMSILYLGILFNNELDLKIDCVVNDQHYELNYFWSILALYHDIGYIVENNKSNVYKIHNRNKSNCLKRFVYPWNLINKEICFDFYFIHSYTYHFSNVYKQIFMNNRRTFLSREETDAISNVSDLELVCRGKKTKIDKAYFKLTTVEKYYRYRIDEFDLYDHGIAGGYMLFDGLITNYKNKMKDKKIKQTL